MKYYNLMYWSKTFHNKNEQKENFQSIKDQNETLKLSLSKWKSTRT